MCGIAGVFSPQTERNRADFHALGTEMHQCMAHRGPDSADVWQDPDLPLLLAHRRLAILDLSPEGQQPMTSASGRYIIAYNGEIYNYRELQNTLTQHGQVFRGRSDTEVILAAIEQWGLNETLQKLNGMFAIALWDRKSRELHLIRDRMGKKPLYCGWSGTDFVFSSELKAIGNHNQFQPKISQRALSLFMRFGYVTAPYSIYKDIWMLRPGHRLTISESSLKDQPELSHHMQPYWDHLDTLKAARRRSETKPDAVRVEEFEELLGQSVEERMISDVPLGAFLSGGIDSSAVVALMQQRSASPVKTYTIGFHESGFDEAAYAKQVADHLGTDHHELYLKAEDALDVIPSLPQIYDEPFADVSAIPTYLVSKFARESVTVALSGDGGDEMLGGYNRHITAPQIWQRMKLLPRPLRRTLSAIIQSMPGERLDKLMKNHPQFGTRLHKAAAIFGLSSPQDIYMRLLSEWEDIEQLIPGAKEPQIPITAPMQLPGDFTFAEEMMLKDTLSYLPDDILTKVDRASMAVSLEARAPLLDKRIYEHVWSLPLETKIHGGHGKWLLREVLARHVPRDLFKRPKQGFTMPVGQWLRGPLRDWAEDLLSEDKLNAHGLLNTEMIRSTWEAHLNKRGEVTGKLWNILMFQAWYESWMKGPGQ